MVPLFSCGQVINWASLLRFASSLVDECSIWRCPAEVILGCKQDFMASHIMHNAKRPEQVLDDDETDLPSSFVRLVLTFWSHFGECHSTIVGMAWLRWFYGNHWQVIIAILDSSILLGFLNLHLIPSFDKNICGVPCNSIFLAIKWKFSSAHMGVVQIVNSLEAQDLHACHLKRRKTCFFQFQQ